MLEGVHARDYHTGGNLVINPSKLDYETLNKAYRRSHRKIDEGKIMHVYTGITCCIFCMSDRQ